MAPSGASTGEFEALELRDGDKSRYLGKGVSEGSRKYQYCNQRDICREWMHPIFMPLIQAMIDADGTKDKSKLGANAILAVSIASCKSSSNLPGYSPVSFPGRYLRQPTSGSDDEHYKRRLLMQLSSGLDVQEFMIMPVGAPSFKECLRWCAEVFHALASILKDRGLATSVGDEGGFAPALEV